MMAPYNVFEPVMNNFEETINFCENGKWKLCTLGVIKISEVPKRDELQITSYYKVDGRIFLGINNSLRILENISQPHQVALFEFPHILDNIVVSPCGKFILICSRNGEIIIRDLSFIIVEKERLVINGEESENMETRINEKGKLVYDCPEIFNEKLECPCLDKSQQCFVGTFVDDVSETLAFYVVTCLGLVKKIALTTDDNGDDHFVSVVVLDFKRNINVCSFAYPFFCLEGEQLLILDLRTYNYEIDDALGIKSLHAIGHNFLAFDNVGNVFKLDSSRCLIFALNNELPHLVDEYNKLLVLQEGEKRFIVGLTKDEPKIQLLSFLDFSLTYDIPLEYPVHLINMKGFTEEVLFLVEVHKNNTVSEVRLQYVSEADPELRVRRLVQKGLIEEAELFARTFNVDPEFLAKVKAEHIMEKLQCTTENINELFKIMDTITDQSFRMNCCDSVICETATDTRRVLCFGAFMDIEVRDCTGNEGNPLLFMKRKFNRTLHRFDTYMQVYPEYNQRKWRYFADCDLIEEVKMFLRQGQIGEATIIYSRLDRDEIISLTEERITEVTAMLNQSLLAGTTFLNTFIPLTLKYKPNALYIFVEWIHDRVYQLEKENDLDFPNCAITFLEGVTGLLNMYIPSQCHLGDESREVLTNLLKALNNIEMLVSNFSIKLPLSEYLSAPQDIVRTLLNIELESTHFENLMKEFLYPFMLKCGVDVDALFMEEIKGLFVYDEEYWVDIVHVLLKFVAKVDTKLEAIKDLLEIASKPWSEKVRQIARMTFEHTSTSPFAAEIVELLRDEHILIVLQKYNINRKQFDSLTDKLFYFHRILYLNRTDPDRAIEDIHQLCRDNDDRFQADLLMINDFIKTGNTEKAIMLIDRIEPQKMCILGKDLLENILFMGEQGILPIKYRQAYQAAINPLWNRLSKFSQGKERSDMFNVYQIAKAVYGIYSEFGIKVNSSVLTRKEKDKILNDLFQKVLDLISAEDDCFSFETLIRNCKKIAYLLGDDLESILLKFMKCGDDLNLFFNIGNYILEESRCSELLTSCAVNLFKYSKANLGDCGDETFLDVVVDANKSSSDDDLQTVRLARKLCIKASFYCTTVDEIHILEVLRWIDSCYYLSNIEDQLLLHAEMHQMYLPNSRLYDFGMSFEAIKTIFNLFCAFAEPLRVGNFKYLTCFESNQVFTEDEFSKQLQQFMLNLGILLKQDQHLKAFNMLKTIQRSCLYCSDIRENILKYLQKFILNSVLPELIEKVLSHKYIDKILFMNLMLLVDKSNYEEQLSKYLTIYKKQPKKLNVITQVGLNLLSYHEVKHGKDDLFNILNLCKWWFRINGPKIKYESYFTSKPESRLEMLVKEEKVMLEDLPEYCSDFGLDLQHCYLKYLKIILLNWKPDVEYVTEVSCKKNIVIKNSEGELMSKCSKALEYISDKKVVLELTEQIWPLINFYYYEVYLVILFIHFQVASSATIPGTYRPLLYFLKTYRRVSRPTRSEIELWYGTFPFKALIDPLSEFRLPLTSTFLSSDIWNIIKQEVNLDTYKEWFKVATILKQYLNEEDICTYAINNPLSSGLINSTCNTWELSLKYDHLLPKVDECARNIRDLERATAVIYALMCGMPPGADKVQMAELSYKYAQLYREAKTTEDVEKVYVKVKQRYLNYSAIHILHKYQLAEDKYLEQVAQPSDLIWELYNDSRVETYFDNLISECPDINKAVEEICSLFGLSVKRESFNVLLKFLKSNSPLDLDYRRLGQGNDSIHLKRACYLCKTVDVTNWQKFLIEQGMKHSIEDDMSFKANALMCFYYVSDIETVEEMSKMDHEQFVNYVDKVSVMAKMNDLGLKFESVVHLDQQKPKRILKTLAKFNKPLAIKCIASLCKIYALDDLMYWEYIINSAVQFHMLRELRDYLEMLKDRCVTDCIKNAWHVILTDSFSNLGCSTSSESEICLLLQTCPVIHELDLDPFIQKCILSERPDIAGTLRKLKIQ